MSNDTLVFERSARTNNWIKGRDRSGLVGSVNWDGFETMLRSEGRLGDNETISQVKIGRNGISYVIDDIIKRI